MSKLMRCISVAEFGGPAVLRLVDNIAIPEPNEKQVLVNVKVAGVNPLDALIRSGAVYPPPLPYTPGKDGGGVVVAVGKDVTKIKKGERVWFSGASSGTYAEYCLVNQDKVGHLPNDIGFEVGAMLGTPYLAAYRALHQKAHMKPGETVFIHGATGGVGIAAIQLCQSFGANVIGTAGTPHGEQMLKELGVDKIYNHRSEGYVEKIMSDGHKIDIILEMVADKNLGKDVQLIGKFGRIVFVGGTRPAQINPAMMIMKESCIMGCSIGHTTPAEAEEQMKSVQEKLDGGFLKPILYKSIPLAQASEAHEEIAGNAGSKGQMVLKVD